MVLNLLRKGLEALAGKHDSRDEEFANLINRNLDALRDRDTLHLYTAILACLNAAVWFSLIFFPRGVRNGLNTVGDLDEKIVSVVIAIVFALGFWLTYVLFRMKFPDLEDPKFDDEVFASFHYSRHSVKRFRVWVASTVGGILNVIVLWLIMLCYAGQILTKS